MPSTTFGSARLLAAEAVGGANDERRLWVNGDAASFSSRRPPIAGRFTRRRCELLTARHFWPAYAPWPQCESNTNRMIIGIGMPNSHRRIGISASLLKRTRDEPLPIPRSVPKLAAFNGRQTRGKGAEEKSGSQPQ
jgi:hypothetical protein